MMVRYKYKPDITGFMQKSNTYATSDPMGIAKAYKGPEASARRDSATYREDWLEKRFEHINSEENE